MNSSRNIALRLVSGIIFLPGIAFFNLAVARSGDSLRCGTDIASIGDTSSQVLEKCGAPIKVETLCAPRNLPENMRNNRNICDPAEDWIYNPGYGQFITILRIQEGKLVDIRYGDRVD